MSNFYRLIRGHVLDVLGSLEAESVDLVCSSPPLPLSLSVRGFSEKIKMFSIFNNVTWHSNSLSPSSPTPISARTRSRVFFTLSKFKDNFCVFSFYFKKWKDLFEYVCRLQIGCLIAIKRLWASTVRFFFIIKSPKIICNKLDCFLINHPNLYSLMVTRINHVFNYSYLVGGFFNTNIPFSVNQPRNISQINIVHTTSCGISDILTFREVED